MLSGPEVGEGCGTCDACKCDRDDGPRAAVICTAEAGGEVMYVMSHQQRRYGNISFTYPTKQAPTPTLQNL